MYSRISVSPGMMEIITRTAWLVRVRGRGQLGSPHDPLVEEVVRDDRRPVIDVADMPADYAHVMLAVQVEPLRDGWRRRDQLNVEILPCRVVALALDVVIPAFLLPDVTAHLGDFTAGDPGALVFTGPKGAQLRRSNFSRAWNKAAAAAGLSGFHFHDLRHTGNTLAGEAGATLRELMDRMGRASTRAALIYQHWTTQRDKMIADEISKRVQAELRPSGTQRARKKRKRSRQHGR